MSDLDRLIRFSVVAEELSFSQAARRLHVDQPWLSRQIQQLESQMGFALFVRSTRKVSLTTEGEALFAHARELARVAEECRQASREMVRAHSSTLAIGVSPYMFWLPERKRIIESFQESHRRVTIDIVSNYSGRLVSKLRKRLIDAALMVEPAAQPDLEMLVVHTGRVSLLVPPEHPLAALRRRASLADMAGREFPAMNQKLNPPFWGLVYQPFVDAGAIPVTAIEGDSAVPFYARERRLPMISICWPHSEQGQLSDFVHVEMDETAPSVRYSLVRRKEPARALLSHFWETARRLSGGADQDVPPARASRVEALRHEREAEMADPGW